MRNFSEIKAFENNFELFHLSKARVIGMEIRSGGSMGNTAPVVWKKVFQNGAFDILKSLPQVLNNSFYGWTCDHDAESDTFSYIVCVLTPAGTPVPEGFVYRDIPETICTKGLYGENFFETLERAKELGYEPNWEPYGWNAELYLDAEEDNPPKQVDTPWHWVIPVKVKM